MLHLYPVLGARIVLSSQSRNLFTFARHQVRGPSIPSRRWPRATSLLWGSVFAISAISALNVVHLDSGGSLVSNDSTESLVDPATSIPFPTTLRLPSKVPLPEFTLVGVGVRTVSFLGIKVYSVAFYADLHNPNLNVPISATPDEKVEHIIRNTACVIRIVPTRSTSYSHLRDGFMRAIMTRQVLGRQRGTLSTEEELNIQSPLRDLKSMFPSTPFKKHTPLDIILTAPPSDPSQSRTLIVRDLGSVHNDWVATEFFLAYFDGNGPSPPLKKSVAYGLETFGREQSPS